MRCAVVLVTRNDPRVIACVQSIFDQKTSFPFEVLVVDNGSTDQTVHVLNSTFGSRPDFHVVTTPGNFGAAWSQGARSTGADLLVRPDADTVAHPAWLEALTRPLRTRDDIHWTAGLVVGPPRLRNFTQRYFHYRTLGYLRRLRGDPLPTDAVPSWNVAYRRQALERAGWYDPWQRSSIDWDLHKRLARTGHRGLFVEEAVLTHDHPRRLRDFYRKERWYRTGHWQMALKYGFRSVLSTFFLPFAYLLLLAIAIVGIWWHLALLGAAALLTLLVVKQWASAVLEQDRVWWARPFFRVVEAAASLHGFATGIRLFGFRRRAPPGAGSPQKAT